MISAPARHGSLVNARPDRNRASWAVLVLALPLLAIYAALTQPIELVTHDGWIHVYRSVVFADALADGVIYPRWVQPLHLGLGSPLFTFQAPLGYYLIAGLARLGVTFPLAWRMLMAASLLAAYLGTYRLVRVITGRRWPALPAAVAYLYAPYILRDAFERGSMEAFSVYLYPWVLWGLWRVAQQPSRRRVVGAALIWAICIGFHPLAPLMLAPVAGLLALVLAWRYRTALPLLALVLGVLLTAFIWLPAFAEQTYVHLEHDFAGIADPVQHPIRLAQLLAPVTTFDRLRANNVPGESLGLAQTLLLVIALPGAWYAWRLRRRDPAWVMAGGGILALLLIWMLTPASDPVWRLLRVVLVRLQFRMRLMGPEALAAAVVTGLLVSLVPRRFQAGASALLAGLLVWQALPLLYPGLQSPRAYFNQPVTLADTIAVEARDRGSGFTTFREFLPRWRTLEFDEQITAQLAGDSYPTSVPVMAGHAGTRVVSAELRTQSWDLSVTADHAGPLSLRLLYYPRWQASIDGRPVPVWPQDATGFLTLELPAGTHKISLRYGVSLAETVGLLIAAVALLAALLAVISRDAGSSPAGSAGRVDLASSGSGIFEQEQEWLPGRLAVAAVVALLVFKAGYVDPQTDWFRCVSTARRVCGAQTSVTVTFPVGPRLRGFTLDRGRLSPGSEVHLTLFWQGAAGDGPGQSTFVHIRNNQSGQQVNPATGHDVWVEEEHLTPGGQFTDHYLPGRLYQDEYYLRLPDDIPAGEYNLEIGWFNPNTGEMLDIPANSAPPPLKVWWRSVILSTLTVY